VGKGAGKREWVKLHAMTGVRTNIVTAVELTDWRSNDTNYLRPTLATKAQNFTVREVSADKGYTSRKNMQAVADLGATPYIPFKATQGGAIPALPTTCAY
jgi:hypothetical protein